MENWYANLYDFLLDIPVDVNFAVYINSLSDIDTTRMVTALIL